MKIAPSILDADFGAAQVFLDSIASADRIHLDIMDGHFVPNLSFGAPVLRHLDFKVETEAHLMVERPENFFESFLELGVGGITFQIENTGNALAEKHLKFLRKKGVRAGICADGFTDVSEISDEVLTAADQVLLMSVKAGKGGQKFMIEVLEKIKKIRARGFAGEIEVDGGVNLQNAPALKSAGADILVVGSFLAKKSPELRAGVISEFRGV